MLPEFSASRANKQFIKMDKWSIISDIFISFNSQETARMVEANTILKLKVISNTANGNNSLLPEKFLLCYPLTIGSNLK